MFCPKCGKDIRDDSVVCPYCGTQVGMPVQQHPTRSNTVAIVGFVFAFLIPLVGLICSIIGVNNAKNCGGSGKGLAIAGIIVSIVMMILSAIFTSIIMDALIDAMQQNGPYIQ